MGFQWLENFNIALLAKQGWRLITQPDSLLSKVLKAKYYPDTDFMNAQLGNLPSYSWKSVWAARGLLDNGLGCRVGTGENISIIEHAWIPSSNDYRLLDSIHIDGVSTVADSTDKNNRNWKQDLIYHTFSICDAIQILQIPLAREQHADVKVWRGEVSGDFTVYSSYKLLQVGDYSPIYNDLQTRNITLFKKIWNLDLPKKI